MYKQETGNCANRENKENSAITPFLAVVIGNDLWKEVLSSKVNTIFKTLPQGNNCKFDTRITLWAI